MGSSGKKLLRKTMYKPLSFSTTMRNPERIADFLRCLAPYDGQNLTSEVIHEVAISLITNKLYYTQRYEMQVPEYQAIYQDENRAFMRDQAEDIMEHSPQNHKEAGFDYGWDSRFDTWYRFPMELGFVYYKMNEPIIISKTGHMLIDAYSSQSDTSDNIETEKIFLNAMMKYQTNNPFRRTSNANAPLILLLQVIKLLREDPETNGKGIFRNELSFLICWPDSDATALYKFIKDFRAEHKFTYGDEIVYEKCLELLGVGRESSKRFKMSQIVGEAVDDFIRKMRFTGVVSLRGEGRFLDFNTYKSDTIDYVLKKYGTFIQFVGDTKEYYEYMSIIDDEILKEHATISTKSVDETRLATLNDWAKKRKKEDIKQELKNVCKKRNSKDAVLRFIEAPVRFEFLTSIALKQHFPDLEVHPNYHVDDEGIPTCHAPGGVADIECYDENCNELVEVTLITSREQYVKEIPSIKDHLVDAMAVSDDKLVFSVFIAPKLHQDTKDLIDFYRFRDGFDIMPYSLDEFLTAIDRCDSLENLL